MGVLKKKYVPSSLYPILQQRLRSIVELLPEDLRHSLADNFERHKPEVQPYGGDVTVYSGA